MNTKLHTQLARLIALIILASPLTALGDLQIQSAQYKEQKGVLYVNGKLTGDGVDHLYVVDADTLRPVRGSGAIDTYARGRQFSAEVPISGFTTVPCMVRVQTNNPNGYFGVFFWARATGNSSATSEAEFSVARVRHAPESCDGE